MRLVSFFSKVAFYGMAYGRGYIGRFFFRGAFRSIGRKCLFFGFPRVGSFSRNIVIGDRTMLGSGVFFSASENAELIVGESCSINTGCHIVAHYGVLIGSGTRIGEYTSIRDQNHSFDDPKASVSIQGYYGSKVSIGMNCWIGRGVFIGPGVTIGDSAVIGANSVVLKDVPPLAVVAGVPAKILRYRMSCSG